MSAEENKTEGEGEKKEKKKDPPLQTNLKTTTETSRHNKSDVLIMPSIQPCNNETRFVRQMENSGGGYFQSWWAIKSESTYFLRTFFFISKFNSKNDSYEEKLPKNFKDFDDLLNKILINLEETENVFINQAKAVMDRDLILVDWRFRLKTLQKTLKETKQDFERIDQTVQCILRLSTHIDDILSKLERELPGPSLIENAFKYSPARMNMYDAMMKININQKDMMQQLSNAVLSINEVIECNLSDPVEQFTQILSLHMEVLRTIEMRTGLLEEQMTIVKTLQKYYKSMKKPLVCDCYCWLNA